MLSKAPALTRLSITRLFTVRRSTRSQKSKSDLNGLQATIEVMAVSPTFLIAARPKRMPSFVGVKFTSLELISGRSEERRVGKECRSRGSSYRQNEKRRRGR